MAKWGEGDPRWIVEQREDGTNVNNWHWSEKNCTGYSRDMLTELLKDTELLNVSGISVQLGDIKVEGEASANNRKGKLIFFYELVLNIKFTATIGDKSVSGDIDVPNLSEENDVDELEFNVTLKKENDAGRKVKDLIRKAGADELRKRITIYLQNMKEVYSKNLILPTHKPSTANAPSTKLQPTSATAPTFTQNSGGRISVASVKDQIEFKCSAQDAFQMLADPGRVQAWARSPIQMEPTVGGAFALFGGNVNGHFTELVPGERLCMDWRIQSWPAGHYSHVTIEFKQGSDSTTLFLSQTDVPSAEAALTQEGWKSNYWRRIQSVFGCLATMDL